MVSLSPPSLGAFADVCRQEGAPWVELGTVGGETLRLGDLDVIAVDRLRDAWSGGLERALGAGGG